MQRADDEKQIAVLLVEDDAGDARLVQRTLKRASRRGYAITHVESIADAMAAVGRDGHHFDLVLLDLNLSDSSGLDGLTALSAVIRDTVPVVILSGLDDEALAEAAITQDVQDYISKQDLSGPALDRAIRYAIERQKNLKALNESRERFRQFALMATDLFWETDAAFRYIIVPAAERSDRHTRRGLIGKTLWETPGTEPLAPATWEEHRRILEQHRPFRDLQILHTSRDGGRTFWSLNGDPVLDPGGGLRGYRGTLTEITERKRDEEALRALAENLNRANHELEQLNARKDRFFSIIAHDLRSPFTALVGTADVIRRGILKADQVAVQEYGELMYAAATRAFNLVEDLLEWSRLQFSGITFESKTFTMDRAIADVVDVARTAADRKGIALQSEGDPTVTVQADRRALGAVLRNLIGNAIKFTAPGGTVRIAVGRSDGMVAVSVSDTGVGIPAKRLGGLFSIAERSSTTGTDGELGTGLGLILCKELTERNGGTIAVESTVGKGSTFRFTVPSGGAVSDSAPPANSRRQPVRG